MYRLDYWPTLPEGKFIPDKAKNGPDGVLTSTITVAGNEPVPFTDLGVRLNIRHSFDRDLEVSLTAPSGNTVLLFSGVGSKWHDFRNTILSDTADISIDDDEHAVPPFAGCFIPMDALSSLPDTDARGAWTLTIRDKEYVDAGFLFNWSLLFDLPCRGQLIRFQQCDLALSRADAQPPTQSTATGSAYLEFLMEPSGLERPLPDAIQRIDFSVAHNVQSAGNVRISEVIPGMPVRLIAETPATTVPVEFSIDRTQIESITDAHQTYLQITSEAFPEGEIAGQLGQSGCNWDRVLPNCETEAARCQITMAGPGPETGTALVRMLVRCDYSEFRGVALHIEHTVADAESIGLYQVVAGQSDQLLLDLGEPESPFNCRVTPEQMDEFPDDIEVCFKIISTTYPDGALRGDLRACGCAFTDENVRSQCNLPLAGAGSVTGTAQIRMMERCDNGQLSRVLLLIEHNVPNPQSVGIYENIDGQSDELRLDLGNAANPIDVSITAEELEELPQTGKWVIKVVGANDIVRGELQACGCPIAYDYAGPECSLPLSGSGSATGTADVSLMLRCEDNELSRVLFHIEHNVPTPQSVGIYEMVEGQPEVLLLDLGNPVSPVDISIPGEDFAEFPPIWDCGIKIIGQSDEIGGRFEACGTCPFTRVIEAFNCNVPLSGQGPETGNADLGFMVRCDDNEFDGVKIHIEHTVASPISAGVYDTEDPVNPVYSFSDPSSPIDDYLTAEQLDSFPEANTSCIKVKFSGGEISGNLDCFDE